MISETLIKISNEYIEQKNIAFANNELASFIRKSAKNIKSELS